MDSLFYISKGFLASLGMTEKEAFRNSKLLIFFCVNVIKISETMKKILEKIQNQKGVSLTELIVAVFVFSLVVTAASGIFLNAIKAQRAIIAKKNVAEDTQYVMEFMVKELRMAKANTADLTLTFKKADGSSFTGASLDNITFINFNNETIKYALSGTKIQRNDIDITSDNIKINFLSFTLNAWDLTQGSGTAPLINILIKAESANGVGGQIEIQTSVSPRIY